MFKFSVSKVNRNGRPCAPCDTPPEPQRCDQVVPTSSRSEYHENEAPVTDFITTKGCQGNQEVCEWDSCQIPSPPDCASFVSLLQLFSQYIVLVCELSGMDQCFREQSKLWQSEQLNNSCVAQGQTPPINPWRERLIYNNKKLEVLKNATQRSICDLSTKLGADFSLAFAGILKGFNYAIQARVRSGLNFEQRQHMCLQAEEHSKEGLAHVVQFFRAVQGNSLCNEKNIKLLCVLWRTFVAVHHKFILASSRRSQRPESPVRENEYTTCLQEINYYTNVLGTLLDSMDISPQPSCVLPYVGTQDFVPKISDRETQYQNTEDCYNSDGRVPDTREQVENFKQKTASNAWKPDEEDYVKQAGMQRDQGQSNYNTNLPQNSSYQQQRRTSPPQMQPNRESSSYGPQNYQKQQQQQQPQTQYDNRTSNNPQSYSYQQQQPRMQINNNLPSYQQQGDVIRPLDSKESYSSSKTSSLYQQAPSEMRSYGDNRPNPVPQNSSYQQMTSQTPYDNRNPSRTSVQPSSYSNQQEVNSVRVDQSSRLVNPNMLQKTSNPSTVNRSSDMQSFSRTNDAQTKTEGRKITKDVLQGKLNSTKTNDTQFSPQSSSIGAKIGDSRALNSEEQPRVDMRESFPNQNVEDPEDFNGDFDSLSQEEKVMQLDNELVQKQREFEEGKLDLSEREIQELKMFKSMTRTQKTIEQLEKDIKEEQARRSSGYTPSSFGIEELERDIQMLQWKQKNKEFKERREMEEQKRRERQIQEQKIMKRRLEENLDRVMQMGEQERKKKEMEEQERKEWQMKQQRRRERQMKQQRRRERQMEEQKRREESQGYQAYNSSDPFVMALERDLEKLRRGELLDYSSSDDDDNQPKKFSDDEVFASERELQNLRTDETLDDSDEEDHEILELEKKRRKLEKQLVQMDSPRREEQIGFDLTGIEQIDSTPFSAIADTSGTYYLNGSLPLGGYNQNSIIDKLLANNGYENIRWARNFARGQTPQNTNMNCFVFSNMYVFRDVNSALSTAGQFFYQSGDVRPDYGVRFIYKNQTWLNLLFVNYEPRENSLISFKNPMRKWGMDFNFSGSIIVPHNFVESRSNLGDKLIRLDYKLKSDLHIDWQNVEFKNGEAVMNFKTLQPTISKSKSQITTINAICHTDVKFKQVDGYLSIKSVQHLFYFKVLQ